jgi:hypothetical protein
MGCVETRGICVCIMIYSVYVCEALDCVYICRVCVYNNWTDAAPYKPIALLSGSIDELLTLEV